MADTREDVIRCEGIWKIFGDKSRQAMEAVRPTHTSSEGGSMDSDVTELAVMASGSPSWKGSLQGRGMVTDMGVAGAAAGLGHGAKGCCTHKDTGSH